MEIQITSREAQVGIIAGRGYSYKRIAAELHISSRTAETHLQSLYGKLGIKTRDEIVDLYRKGSIMDHRIVQAAEGYNVDRVKLEEAVVDEFGYDYSIEDIEAVAEEMAK